MTDMNIAVSRSLGIPIATQIRDQIVAAISVGDLRTGDRLPTIRELAAFLNINRNTVAQVYRLLEAEGYLTTRAGGGTTVADRRAPAAASADTLRELVQQALGEAEAAGFSASEFARLAYYEAARPPALPAPQILVVDEYRGELDHLGAAVRRALPDGVVDELLVADLQATEAEQLSGYDFAVVAFYSLDQAQPLLAAANVPILAAGIGPSLSALRQIAEHVDDHRVAIVCTEPEGPSRMEASLRGAGIVFATEPVHAHVGQDDLATALDESDVAIVSQGAEEAVSQLVPDKPIIPYARLLSDETLATLRNYTAYVRDRSRSRR